MSSCEASASFSMLLLKLCGLRQVIVTEESSSARTSGATSPSTCSKSREPFGRADLEITSSRSSSSSQSGVSVNPNQSESSSQQYVLRYRSWSVLLSPIKYSWLSSPFSRSCWHREQWFDTDVSHSRHGVSRDWKSQEQQPEAPLTRASAAFSCWAPGCELSWRSCELASVFWTGDARVAMVCDRTGSREGRSETAAGSDTLSVPGLISVLGTIASSPTPSGGFCNE